MPALASPENADRTPELERAHRLVTDGSCTVLSLDVFDTVLWRRAPRPTDVFGMLGAKLRRAGQCPPWLTEATFRLIRIEAEKRARDASVSASGEVSLFDIWREMPLSVFGGLNLEELVAAEVQLEREVTVPDLHIAELVHDAAKNDVPIVLVSDTYFTADQLSYLLDRPVLVPLNKAKVFRSHQHGLPKSGGLFEVVLQELGTRPEQVVHLGDNPVADDEAPAELGIRTIHYCRIDDEFAPVLEREGESTDSFAPLDDKVHPDYGDCGLTSLRAKALRQAPTEVGDSARIAWRFGAGVLGPVLTAFAEWVARRAHEAGHQDLWCPMREGELLSELINNAAAKHGWEVTARPIWLSRQVTSLATLDCYDENSVEDFIGRSYRLTIAQLLASLHLRPGDVPALADKLDMSLDQPDLRRRVTVALTEAPHLRNRLASTVTAARDRLLRALRKTGALESPVLPLVDLGWGGTIQYQLTRVLERSRIDVRASGFYIVTDQRSARLSLTGGKAEGFLGQSGHPSEVVQALTRSPEVIEQCVSALCGSLVDFTDDGDPVLAPTNNSPAQDLERRSAQEGILAFQKTWNQYTSIDDAQPWPALDAGGTARLAAIMTAALRAPTSAEATVFGNWHHEDNFGSSVITRILPADLSAAVPYMSPGDLDDLHMRDAFWPGLLAAGDPQLRAAITAVHTRAVDPGIFEMSHEAPETRLRFRTADDKWHEGPRRRVRINHNGLSFARLDFASDGALDVSLAVPGQPAIVRIDWIEVTAYVSGDPRQRKLRWERPEDFAGLVFADCAWLGGTMVEFHAPHGAFWLPLANHAGGPVTSAQINIAFATLPQSDSGLAPRMATAPDLVRMAGRLREEYRASGMRGVMSGAARVAYRRLGGL
ncbi:HAD family hydrolase [Saccharopolyspora karakumensis]|uniref:HAD family hydrolase n=1 Tax=Saccharopolyspora karakumensis TaxID=2530386 RepID=A0A4R5BQ92_9PSEU|nr:HAD family hydrolase [Saccharopolyspora karakumensis]